MHYIGTGKIAEDGIANESNVWLRQNFLLRSLITKLSPSRKELKNQFFITIQNDLISFGLQAMAMLLQMEPSCEMREFINKIITGIYGTPLSKDEVINEVDKRISHHNHQIQLNNSSLKWYPNITWPELNEDQEICIQLKELISKRLIQKNTLDEDEFNSIMKESIICKWQKEWIGFLKKTSKWS